MRRLLPAVLLTACTTQFDPCFDPAALVTGFRVLGVRTDPPEALADLAAGSVQSVQARVLAPSFVSGDLVQVGATACAGGCASAELVREPAPLGEEAAFPVVVSPQLLVEAALADPLRGLGGIQLELRLRVRSADGTESVARKTLLYATAPQTDEVNHAFEVTGLRVRRRSHWYHQELGIPLPPDEEVLLPGQLLRLDRFDAVWLRPLLGPGDGAAEAMEVYDTTDLSGRRVRLRETVTYSFYVTAGGSYGLDSLRNYQEPYFEPSSSASEPDPDSGQDPDGVTSLTARNKGGGQGYLWIVARDSRGAQAWLAVPWVEVDATLQPHDLFPELGHHCVQGSP